MCALHTEVSTGTGFPWSWSYRWLRVVMYDLDLSPGPLQEEMLLTSEPSPYLKDIIFDSSITLHLHEEI